MYNSDMLAKTKRNKEEAPDLGKLNFVAIFKRWQRTT